MPDEIQMPDLKDPGLRAMAGLDGGRDPLPELKDPGLRAMAGYADDPQYDKLYAAKKNAASEGISTYQAFTRKYALFGDLYHNNVGAEGRQVLGGNTQTVGNSEYQQAQRRYQEGKASDADIRAIALYEEQQDFDARVQSTPQGKLIDSIGGLAKIAGEAATGGAVLSRLAALRGGVKAGQVLASPVAAAAAPSAFRAGARAFGQKALATAAAPGFYVPMAQQQNMKFDRDANAASGYAPAYAYGVANMIVLGRLQGAGGQGLRGFVQKGAGASLEMSVVDLGAELYDEAAKATGMGKYVTDRKSAWTRAGRAAGAGNGKELNDVLEETAVQALSFGLFGAMHSKLEAKAVPEKWQRTLDKLVEKGLPPELALREIDGVHKTAQEYLNSVETLEGRTPGKADLQELFADIKDPALREYADTISEAFVPKKATARPESPKQEVAAAASEPAPLEVRAKDKSLSPEERIAAAEEAFQKTKGAVVEPPQAPEPPTPVAAAATKKPFGRRPLPVIEAPRPEVAAEQTAAGPVESPRIAPVEPEVRQGSTPDAPVGEAGRPKPSQLRLGDGLPAGKDAQGNRLTHHDVLDANSSPIGEVRVFLSGKTLRIDWVGAAGMAGGEGRGSNPVGAREVLRLLPELARLYPDAIVAKYTPSSGRIKAGEAKQIDLEAVRKKYGIAEAPKDQAPHPEQRSVKWQEVYDSMEPLVGAETARQIADKEAGAAPEVAAAASPEPVRQPEPVKAPEPAPDSPFDPALTDGSPVATPPKAKKPKAGQKKPKPEPKAQPAAPAQADAGKRIATEDGMADPKVFKRFVDRAVEEAPADDKAGSDGQSTKDYLETAQWNFKDRGLPDVPDWAERDNAKARAFRDDIYKDFATRQMRHLADRLGSVLEDARDHGHTKAVEFIEKKLLELGAVRAGPEVGSEAGVGGGEYSDPGRTRQTAGLSGIGGNYYKIVSRPIVLIGNGRVRDNYVVVKGEAVLTDREAPSQEGRGDWFPGGYPAGAKPEPVAAAATEAPVRKPKAGAKKQTSKPVEKPAEPDKRPAEPVDLKKVWADADNETRVAYARAPEARKAFEEAGVDVAAAASRALAALRAGNAGGTRAKRGADDAVLDFDISEYLDRYKDRIPADELEPLRDKLAQMTVKAIAEKYGVSVGTAHARANAGYEKLKQLDPSFANSETVEAARLSLAKELAKSKLAAESEFQDVTTRTDDAVLVEKATAGDTTAADVEAREAAELEQRELLADPTASARPKEAPKPEDLVDDTPQVKTIEGATRHGLKDALPKMELSPQEDLFVRKFLNGESLEAAYPDGMTSPMKKLAFQRDIFAKIAKARPDLVKGVKSLAELKTAMMKDARDDKGELVVAFAGVPIRTGLPQLGERLFGKARPEGDYDGAGRGVSGALKRLLRGGNVDAVRLAKEQEIDQQIGAHEADVAAAARDFYVAVKSETGKSYDKSDGDYRAAVDMLLHTKAEDIADTVRPPFAAYTKVGPEVIAAVVQFRRHIDKLSKQLRDSGMVDGDLDAAFEANEGVYVKREYQAFKDANWESKVPADVQARFKNWLREQFMNAPENAGKTISDAELDARMRSALVDGKAAENPMEQISALRILAKDISVLRHKKDIPEPVRALWGEIKDPLVNYVNSVGKIAHLLTTHNFMTRVAKEGYGTFLFDKDNLAAFAERFPGSEGAVKLVDTGNLKGAALDPFEPLAGYYTTKEIKQAMQAMFTKETTSALASMYFKWLGAAKYAKTALSLPTHGHNLLGNAFFLLGNGHYGSAKYVGKALKAVVSDTAEGRAYWRTLVEHGLAGEGVMYKEFGDMMRRAFGEQDLAKLDDNITVSMPRVWEAVKKVGRAAGKAYHLEDVIPKIMAFEAEKAQWGKAYPEWSPEKLNRHAAEIVRDTFPTASKVVNPAKAVKNLPFAPFVGFYAEMVRASVASMKRGAIELRDPRTRMIGAKRLSGMAAAAGLTYMASLITRALLGVSDKEEEAVRTMLPSKDRDGRLFYFGRDEKTNAPRYVNMSKTDPRAALSDALVAFWRGKDTEDGALNATDVMMKPFVGEEVAVKPVLDVLRNNRQTVFGGGETGKVVNDGDEWGDKLAKRAGHIGQAFVPGTYSQGRKILFGMTGAVEKGSGKGYDAFNETLAMFGQRPETPDVEGQLRFRARDFDRATADAARLVNEKVNDKANVTPRQLYLAKQRADEVRRDAFEELKRQFDAAEALRVPRPTIIKILKEAGASQGDIEAVIAGRVPPLLPEVTGTPLQRSRQIDVRKMNAPGYQPPARDNSLTGPFGIKLTGD